jgi:hypothetical protein
MNTQLKSLDEEIRRRARERATQKVCAWILLMHEMGDIPTLRDDKIVRITYFHPDGREMKSNLFNYLRTTFDEIPKRMIEELTEKYIPEELSIFLADIEELKTKTETIFRKQE